MNDRARPAEKDESLWWIAVPPTIWMAHFLASYLTAAVWCAKKGRGASLDVPRLAIAVYTILALAGIGLVAFRAWRRHSYGDSPPPHDADTPEDRHRFLGYATLMLCGLSTVATLFVALAAVFTETCR